MFALVPHKLSPAGADFRVLGAPRAGGVPPAKESGFPAFAGRADYLRRDFAADFGSSFPNLG